MPSRPRQPFRPTPRPAVDEWGMYDPEQAGLAALFARLAGRSRPRSRAPAAETATTPEPRPSRDRPDEPPVSEAD